MQLPFLASAEVVVVGVLQAVRESEVVQEIAGTHVVAVVHANHFGVFLHQLQHNLVTGVFHPVLREVAELDGLSGGDFTAVGNHFAHDHLQEGALAGTVLAHNAALFPSFEDVGEILDDGLVGIGKVQMADFQNLVADTFCLHFEAFGGGLTAHVHLLL